MNDCVALAGSPRPVGSRAHDDARVYLERRLRELGLVPAFGTDYFHSYFGKFANIAARLPCIGSASVHAKTILLGAHYDTCGETLGADDNAAAVAIVLETVRQLKRAPIACDILVVFFDTEEPPYFQSEAMGSTRFLIDVLLRAGEDAFPIILDLCGHDVPLPGLEPALFVVGLETDGSAKWAFDQTDAPKMLVPLPIPNLALGGTSAITTPSTSVACRMSSSRAASGSIIICRQIPSTSLAPTRLHESRYTLKHSFASFMMNNRVEAAHTARATRNRDLSRPYAETALPNVNGSSASQRGLKSD